MPPSLPRWQAAVALALALLPLWHPAGHARDLNLAGMSRYVAASGEAPSGALERFSDIRPSDWAYQALASLAERYGCVHGFPDGRFGGGRPISRYEAAALLNACLDRISEQTDELRRLMAEFERELALLRGRVDGLEARAGELEAMAFSTTTRFSALATFVVGSNAFGGSASEQVREARALGGTTMNYDLQLALDTSFTGKDRLRTTLRGGNFADSVFGGRGPTGGLSLLEIAYQEECGGEADCGNVLGIDKLFYQTPIGGSLKATIGPRVGQEDLLALWPSVYPGDTVLNVLTLNGAPVAYNKNLGPGVGLSWRGGPLSVSAGYVADEGESADPAQGGIGTAGAAAIGTVQVAITEKQWALAAIWTGVQSGVDLPGTTPFVAAQTSESGSSRTSAYGLSGYWQPVENGWIPSISAGWGINSTRHSSPQPPGSLRTSQSWMVGLQWSDVFAKGNQLGMGVGQPVFATALSDGRTPVDGNYVWEWWYKFQLSDRISLTPALFWLSRPLGQETSPGESFHQLGGLVRTSFLF